MSENTETDKALRYLKSLEGCFPFKIVPGVYGRRGVSDILMCYNGLFISIEMKVGSNKPSDQQLKFMKSVQQRGGGLSFVCWSCEEVKTVMRCVTETMDFRVMMSLKGIQEEVFRKVMKSDLKAVKRGMVNF